MATGDQNDIFGRLKSYLPRGWFGDTAPNRDGLLQGIAAVLANVYSLYAYAKNQTRLAIMTGAWLDMFASDFFGPDAFPRNANEQDGSYRARIKAALFQSRATRPAMAAVLTTLTGRAPVIFEPMNPFDTGALAAPTSKGYCGVARMGSMAVPFNALVIAYRPKVVGGSAGAAFCNAPTLSTLATPASQGYTGSLAAQQSTVSDAAIYAAVNATRPAATVVGVAISN